MMYIQMRGDAQMRPFEHGSYSRTLQADTGNLEGVTNQLNPGRVITLVREEKYEQASLSRYYVPVGKQKVIQAHWMRVFALMRAFAQSHLGDSMRDEAQLETARPVFAAEFDYLCAYWPELAQFASGLELKELLAIGGMPTARVLSD